MRVTLYNQSICKIIIFRQNKLSKIEWLSGIKPGKPTRVLVNRAHKESFIPRAIKELVLSVSIDGKVVVQRS